MPSELTAVARESDARVAEARARLVQAVRKASAEGLTQTQIAQQIGRSQPEVSRLLRFHGTSELSLRLRRHRSEVVRLIRLAGGRRVRVFGSVALGLDRPGSDVDLLFTMERPLSLLQLGRLESRLADLLQAPVDLVPDDALRPAVREQVLNDAVPL